MATKSTQGDEYSLAEKQLNHLLSRVKAQEISVGHLTEQFKQFSNTVAETKNETAIQFDEIKTLIKSVIDKPNHDLDATLPDNRRRTQIIDDSILETFLTRPISSASNNQPNQPHNPMIKPMEMPLFNGDPDNACKWLRQYELTASLNFWGSQELIRSVGRCLTEDALNWYLYAFVPKLKGAAQT